ncbi:MAG: oligosaccharide repeat unit polymerase [Gallicola sp.]|mgnify:FL=1|uniref:oligosaccharide repeat unit polymerase n=1 Tax=Gallicola sp. Sow4_E12 TaxID=3438785 RepID=UPI00183C6384|nr:oligosaccharide repeat unit polymerase [Gallicola sp.]
MNFLGLSLQDYGILIITIILCALSVRLYIKASGTLSPVKISPISLTFYFFLVFSVIGTTLVAMGNEYHHMMRYMRHGDIKMLAWFLVMILFVLFPAIQILLNKIFKYKPESYQEYTKKKTTLSKNRDAEFIAVSLAAAICIGAVVYTFWKIGISDNPLLNAIRGVDSEQLAFLRNKVSNDFPGNEYIRNIFAVGLTPIISYMAYILMRETKQLRFIILFALLFISSNLISIYDLEKAPIIIYWATFVILSIMYGDKLKWRYLIGLGVVAAAAIVVMYVVIAGSSLDKIFSFAGPINRIILTTPIAFILHLEVFTYRSLLLNGASVPSWVGRLFFGNTDLNRSGRAVMEVVNFDGIRNGTAGVYNGLFLGEAFANFGMLGIFIAMIHVPIMFFLMNFVFVKLKKTPITLALFAYFTVSFLFTLHGGYTDYIWNTMWVLVVIIGIMMTVFIKFLEKINFRKKNVESKESPYVVNVEKEETFKPLDTKSEV